MPLNRDLPFIAGVLYESVFLALALFWGLLAHRSVLGDVHWNLRDMGIGTVATIPPFLFFVWSLKSKLPIFVRHRELLDSLLRRFFGTWSVLQLLVLSICAGVSEEAFFRGAIQGSLAERIGKVLALSLASLAFGAAHLLTWTYAIIAAFIGVYLGLLWIWAGNLAAPMVTHALYDFLALVYFFKLYPGTTPDS